MGVEPRVLVAGYNHDPKTIGQEFDYACFGEWAHVHQTVHDLHLRHDVFNHALTVWLIHSGFRSWNSRLMRLAVQAEDLVLPVLVDSNLQVAATFIARKTERLRVVRLFDGKDDEFGCSFLVGHFIGRLETHNVT